MTFQPGVSVSAGPPKLGGPPILVGPATPAVAVAPVKLNFTTTDVAGVSNGVKCLVYGKAGTGKTTFCGTAPSPLIISAEAGLLSLRGKSIPVITIDTIQELEAALVWCRTNATAQGIKTICLDSISEITEKILASERAKSKDPRQAYGEMANRTIILVKDFRDLSGFNVIVTAKQADQLDALTGVVRAIPTAPGQQVGPALPYLFDLVLHAYTDRNPADGSTYHALRTRSAINAEAKDRSGALDEIEYPSFENILNKINSTGKPA